MTKDPQDGLERRLTPGEMTKMIDEGRFDEVVARLTADAQRPLSRIERFWDWLLKEPLLLMMLFCVAYLVLLDVGFVRDFLQADAGARWGQGLVAFFFIFMTVMIAAIMVVLHKAMRLLDQKAKRRPVLPPDGAPPVDR